MSASNVPPVTESEAREVSESRRDLQEAAAKAVQKIVDLTVPPAFGTYCIVYDHLTGEIASTSKMRDRDIVAVLRIILAELEESKAPDPASKS